MNALKLQSKSIYSYIFYWLLLISSYIQTYTFNMNQTDIPLINSQDTMPY